MAHWQQERLARAIARLLPLQQEVILLRFRNNLHPRQIAAVIGRSAVNVRVIQHRALRQLRNILKDDAAEEIELMRSLDQHEDDLGKRRGGKRSEARTVCKSQ